MAEGGFRGMWARSKKNSTNNTEEVANYANMRWNKEQIEQKEVTVKKGKIAHGCKVVLVRVMKGG